LYGTFFTPRLHVKYGIDENTTLRISGGKGFRSVNLLAENMNYLASSRQFAVLIILLMKKDGIMALT